MSSFCVGCGHAFQAGWAFCPACGAGRVDKACSAATEVAPHSSLREEVTSLLDGGHLIDAEALLRSGLESVPAVETMLLLSVVLTKQHRYSEAGTLLEETVVIDPTNAEAHMRRAEYRGRVGLYDQALQDLGLARRYLRSSEVPALLHCQELERWLRERIKSGFVVHPSLPRLPSWLIRPKRGNQAQPLEAR